MPFTAGCGIIPALMLLFGHTGITLGAAWLARRAVTRHESGASDSVAAVPGRPAVAARKTTPPAHWDYRFLLAGSLLPDIIDKPLGQILLRDTVSNGRIYAHTLLFALLLTALGLLLYRRAGARTTSGLLLSFGTMAHLAEDEMWRAPGTLLWPLFGWSFPVRDLTGWAMGLIEALFSDPGVYIPELLGLAILIWGFVALMRRRKVLSFALRGRAI